jgi:hypothetical protein
MDDDEDEDDWEKVLKGARSDVAKHFEEKHPVRGVRSIGWVTSEARRRWKPRLR